MVWEAVSCLLPQFYLANCFLVQDWNVKNKPASQQLKWTHSDEEEDDFDYVEKNEEQELEVSFMILHVKVVSDHSR